MRICYYLNKIWITYSYLKFFVYIEILIFQMPSMQEKKIGEMKLKEKAIKRWERDHDNIFGQNNCFSLTFSSIIKKIYMTFH